MPDHLDLFDDMARLPDDDLPGMPDDTVKRHPMPCPPLGIVLACADSIDTSITPRRRARIREHTQHGETCQMHLERAQGEVLHGVHEILKDAHDVNQAALRARDSRFHHALRVQVKKMAPPLGSHHPLRQWLPIAATLAVIVIGSLLFRPAVTVIHAEELFNRAMASERAHAAGSRQRVRQSLSPGMITLGRAVPDMPRIAPFSTIRDVVDGAVVAEMRPVSVTERDAHVALARLFEKHHFDWRKPFCLTCHRAWHASLANKRDSVTLTGDILTLRTTTPDSDVREVTLAFRRDTYHVVRETFLFEGLGRIDVEELARQESAPGDQRASLAESRAVASAGTDRLAPNVSGRPPAAGDPERAASRRLALSRWLDRTFPPSASDARTAFVPDIERRVSAVRRHLIKLQRLAKTSKSVKSGSGTGADRVQLRQQVELEYQALVTHLRSLEGYLNVLLGTGTRSSELRTPLPADWQRRAAAAMPHATRLQHRLQRIFTHDDLPLEETRATHPGSARAAFEALWESLHAEPRE